MPEPVNVSILLHAHLPYGLRPELDLCREETWLFETVTDVTLPLLRMLDRLGTSPGGEPRLAVSLSPPLLSMWAHPCFPARYRAHLRRGQAIFAAEADDASLPEPRRTLARHYRAQWAEAEHDFTQTHAEDLPAAWTRLARTGVFELVTTASTHAFLPGFQHAPETRRAQIGGGLDACEAATGLRPTGFWLPECAYFPGLEHDLAAAGIRWFAVEAGAIPGPVCRCANGVLALARDGALSRRVWDARQGYPGHAAYREFHRDAGHDLDAGRAGPYRLSDGSTLPLGLKYWRVTGAADKDFYDPEAARDQAGADAEDFVRAMLQTAASAEGPVFLPFDAELFGHWWHEGPHWLEQVLRHMDETPALRACAPGCLLGARNDWPAGRPRASTWGQRADYSFWLNAETDWIYPLLDQARTRLAVLPEASIDAPLARRVRDQAERELRLAEASDWPFMVRAGATPDYAQERLRRHLVRCHALADMLEKNAVAPERLAALEYLDRLLPCTVADATEKP